MLNVIKCKFTDFKITNLVLIRFHNNRGIKTCCSVLQKQELNEKPEDAKNHSEDLIKLLGKYQDKILYSGYLEKNRIKFGYRRKCPGSYQQIKEEKKRLWDLQCVEPLPYTLKYLLEDTEKEDGKVEENVKINEHVHFPYKNSDTAILPVNDSKIEDKQNDDIATIADVEIKTRLQLLNAKPVNWMTDYENYSDTDILDYGWKVNYGTPDPKATISNVPCGGCGALLHCKDTAIPGYIPSEIFKNYRRRGGVDLQQIICQRCYFLKVYNCALQVRVSANDYPQVLRVIRNKRALVILLVDLLDFPCSIWPGIADLLGPGQPVFIVGNKVDLLPQDGKGFFERVAHVLYNSAREAGFATVNVKDVALISAKTGFGVENLITKLFSFWKYSGDVFLLGCTNVGKSSLFNALLQSDYCKSEASDLIQRATTSPWPGTTLNLLKFPIMRPRGSKLYARTERLIKANKLEAQERKLRKNQLLKTKDIVQYATLIGHIEKTFAPEESVVETDDLFSVKGNTLSEETGKFGIDDESEVHVLSKWCYDTPGVVQDDQIIHLLTTDELMLTLPKELIIPITFGLNPYSTIFIGGLGRLDYVEGEDRVRFTVFCSSGLPITVCSLDSADQIYEDLVGTDVFSVPINKANRLKFWPGLQVVGDYKLKGVDWEYSCGDIVLSSAGWIAVTCKPDVECKLRAWTPEKRGVHLRESLLPKGVSLRGKKIRHCPAYKTNRFYVK